MSTQVTLTLSAELYEQAQRWAALTQQDLSETLTEALSIVLTPMHTAPGLERPVSSLSNRQVVELARVRMKPGQGQRLTELLEHQREGQLTERESAELIALMQVYHQLWLRQAEALAEGVRRGLLSPLAS
jgi:hypothetical protein